MMSPADALSHTPEIFPHSLDVRGDAVNFIRLSRGDYQRASFLDERILTPSTLPRRVPWLQAAAAIDSAGLSERCGFIFHIGHVGSTLLSRLIGAHPRAFSLREPLVLRTFALARSASSAQPTLWSDAEFDSRLGNSLKLLSRTFEANQVAIVKATSFVSELADQLLARAFAPKGVLMFVSPETYMATILGGVNSRREAKILTPDRVRRLHRRLGREVWAADALSEGETLALGWACEMAGLAQAARAAGGRALRVDFDGFLASPDAALLAVLRHFGIDATPAEANAILAGPTMHRYSKGPEHAYDAALRMEVLREARAVHGAEIARGLAWLDRAAADYPPVRDAVAFARRAAS